MKPGSELKKWVGTYSTKGGAEMITGEFQIDHYGWDFCKSFPLLGKSQPWVRYGPCISSNPNSLVYLFVTKLASSLSYHYRIYQQSGHFRSQKLSFPFFELKTFMYFKQCPVSTDQLTLIKYKAPLGQIFLNSKFSRTFLPEPFQAAPQGPYGPESFPV